MDTIKAEKVLANYEVIYAKPTNDAHRPTAVQAYNRTEAREKVVDLLMDTDLTGVNLAHPPAFRIKRITPVQNQPPQENSKRTNRRSKIKSKATTKAQAKKK